jgi:hypothetical protein
MNSALEAAHADLEARVAAADRSGDWQERSVLEPLASVADHLQRIADHGDSAHYRADKSGPLVTGAVRVQKEVFCAYGGWPHGDSAPARRMAEATEVLGQVVDAVRIVLWQAAQAARDGAAPVIYTYQTGDIRKAARAVARWADGVAATAVPDPDQENGWRPPSPRWPAGPPRSRGRQRPCRST